MRPLTLEAPWSDLVRSWGTLEALAAAVPCNPRSIRRWANGVRPQALFRERLREFFNHAGLSCPLNCQEPRRSAGTIL